MCVQCGRHVSRGPVAPGEIYEVLRMPATSPSEGRTIPPPWLVLPLPNDPHGFQLETHKNTFGHTHSHDAMCPPPAHTDVHATPEPENVSGRSPPPSSQLWKTCFQELNIRYSTSTEFPFPLKRRHPGYHLTKEHEDIVHWGLVGEKGLVKSGSKRSLSRPVTREHVSQLLQGSWITNLSLLWLTLKTLSFKGESIELHSALQLLNIEWLGPACKHTCT